MNVAQTTQLIQMILNTCLLMAIAVAWWGIVWVRYSAIAHRLSYMHQQVVQGRVGRKPLRALRHQYRLGRYSTGIMHYVLLGLVLSLLGLSLRTLVGANWLISLSLLLFIAALVGLLLSVGLALLEFYGSADLLRRHSRMLHYKERRRVQQIVQSRSSRQLPALPAHDRMAS